MQRYQQYRPTIKAITKWSGDIFSLPKIPVATQYKLMGLGDVTLISGVGDCVTDNASVADYDQTKRNSLLPFKIEGRNIRVDMTQFEYFLSLMITISKSNLSAENFRHKLVNGGEYLGIEWNSYDGYEAIGRIKSDDIYTRLSGYYNKQ
jgi:hypothetical protein